eukprot:jgi/Bigna1/70685/fgenesh1_pg.12_\
MEPPLNLLLVLLLLLLLVVYNSKDFTRPNGKYNNRRSGNVVLVVVVTTLAGKAGEMGKQDGFGSNARFGEMMGPIGLSLDTSNRYLIAADGDNHNIRRVDVLTGEVTTIAGTGKARVAVDQDDNILVVEAVAVAVVADTQNSRIRRINTV